MEYLPVILSLSLVTVFSFFVLFVKAVRITSCVILLTALINLWMMDSYNMLMDRGETIGLLIMGSVDMMAAMSLLIFHTDSNARKAPQQAIVFTLFAICHGVLAYDVFSAQFIFYEVYDYVIAGLTAAHVLVMGGYYEELYKNFKKVLGSWSSVRRSFGFKRRLFNKKLRDDSLDNLDRSSLHGNISSSQGDQF